jgi:hypothetical protein
MDTIFPAATRTFSGIARGFRQLHFFLFMPRGDMHTLPTSDLAFDRPSPQNFMFVRESKGDQRRDTRDKLIWAVPIPANPLLSDLMDYYHNYSATFCETCFQRPPPADVWSVSPLKPSAEWKAASTLPAWLALVLRSTNTTLPAGFKWTSHNLQKGTASAASSIGAPLPVIKYMSSLAKNSSVTEGKYIDPTMAPSPVVWRFFGRLAPSA